MNPEGHRFSGRGARRVPFPECRSESGPGDPRRSGSILIGVLWCVALLAVIVVSTLHSARLGLVLARHHGDDVQAHYLALAGIEKAKALLAADQRQSRRAGRITAAELADSPAQFRDVALGRGRFSVLRRDASRPGAVWLYGVSDESARLNLNVAPTNELLRVPGLTADIAAAILDWRDGDNATGPGGAEVDHYASLVPPHMVRNGPFQTVRELLMVRGVTAELLLGRPLGRRAEEAPPADPERPAWEDLFTVHSSAPDTDAAGEARVNVQTADETALTGVRGITPEIAKAIVAHRGRTRFETLADLLDVGAAPATGALQPNGVPVPQGGGNPGGPKIISETLLQDLADHLTVGEGDEARGTGLVNVNTAGLRVLSCLPGVETPLAQAIISQRESAGPFPHTLALLKVPGVDRDRLKLLLPRVTARSETYRIHAEGTVPGRGNRRHIETVVRISATGFTTLAYREDDL